MARKKKGRRFNQFLKLVFPGKKPEQSEENRDAQLKAAADKKQRRLERDMKLVAKGALKLADAPVYVPWDKAKKELGLEHAGVDLAHGRDVTVTSDLYEVAKMDESDKGEQ